MAMPTHVENMVRMDALENVLFPRCGQCHEKMTPISMRFARMAGGEEQITMWECSPCARLMEERKQLRVVYRINDVSEPAVTFNESDAHRREQEEKRLIGATLDGAYQDKEVVTAG